MLSTKKNGSGRDTIRRTIREKWAQMKGAVRRLLRPSFPKGIFLATAICAFVMVKFRVPEPSVEAKREVPRPTMTVVKTKLKKPVVLMVERDPVEMEGSEIAIRTQGSKQALGIKKTSHLKKKKRLKRARLKKARRYSRRNRPIRRVRPQGPTSVQRVLHALYEPEFEFEANAETSQAIDVLKQVAATQAEAFMPRRDLQIVIGEIVQNDFLNIKDSLAEQRAAVAELDLESKPVKPEPELVIPVKSRPAQPRKIEARAVVKPTTKKAEPELVRPTVVTPAKPVAVAKPEPELVRPTPVQPVDVAKIEPTPTPKPATVSALFAQLGSVGGSLPTQPTAPPVVTHVAAVPERMVTATEKNILVVPSVARSAPAENRLVVKKPAEPAGPPAPQVVERASTVIDERINGRLHIEAEVDGHVEIYLQALGSRATDDKLPTVEYRWPVEDFRIVPPEGGLAGSYRLVAAFYRPGQADPIARVPGKVVSAANQREMIHWEIGAQQIQTALDRTEASPAGGVIFTANVYPVDTANARRLEQKRLTEVTSGRLVLVGYEKWGHAEIQPDGTLRLPLPAHSELLARLEAPNFFPASVIIPTGSTAVHERFHLAHETELDPIVAYFTGKVPQKKDPKRSDNDPMNITFSMIFGRVFHPESRGPMVGAPIEIVPSFSADEMLESTSESGFFGYTNVYPSMRAVRHVGGHPYLVNAQEGAAQYLEFGKGGKFGALRGRIIDRTTKQAMAARIRLPGGKHLDTKSGAFVFDQIDFPSGIVTFEIEASGYPTTWHNVAYRAGDEKDIELSMLSDQAVQSGLKASPEVRRARKGAGILIGEIERAFFKGGDCLRVTLTSSLGAVAHSQQGPFPFAAQTVNRTLPYCVSREVPAYTFFNLKDGEYQLSLESSNGRILRAHVVRIGNDRITFNLN